MIKYIKELLEYKELLINLTFKDLKLKYRNSVLGFLWSFFNPILMLIVYNFAFKLILKVRVENFTVYLLAGLLPWTFFQAAMQVSTSSIVNNANLIRKVYFPREILPLSAILSSFINFLITLTVLFLSLIIFKIKINFSILLLPLVLILLLLFTIGLSLILSSLNVLYRDISHFIEIIFMLWFYLTPVVYSITMIPEKYRVILLLNPMTLILECIRTPLLYRQAPNIIYMSVLVIIDIFLIYFGYKIFKKLEKVFAEEI